MDTCYESGKSWPEYRLQTAESCCKAIIFASTRQDKARQLSFILRLGKGGPDILIGCTLLNHVAKQTFLKVQKKKKKKKKKKTAFFYMIRIVEKMTLCQMRTVNSEGPDGRTHLCSLIWTFSVRRHIHIFCSMHIFCKRATKAQISLRICAG